MKSVLGLSLAFGVFASPVVRAELPDTVGLREIATAGTNNQTLTVTGTHLIEGTVRKTGSGAWTVPAATVFSGSRAAWDVLAGSVALTGIGAGGEMELAAAPTAVLNQAALWMAADENVIYTDNGGVNEVSAWLDVREPDTAAPYVYTRAVSKTNFTNAVPELKTSGAGPDSSLPYLWFGGYHSGRWMDWTDPADASKHLNTIHHVFVVHGTHDSYGYFLGITESDATTFPLDFRKDDYSSASGATGMIWENAAYGYTATALRTGRTFLNRVLVDGAATPVPRGYQLIGAEVGCRPANAGNFFNCRNLFPGTGARVGGDRLCEAVIFTNRLSETDRVKVEHYLWQKWFGRAPQSPVGLNVAAGATGAVEVATGMTVDCLIRGDGRLAKQGGGTLRLTVDKDTPLTTLNTSFAFTDGTVDARVPVALASAAGVCYSNQNFILSRSAAEAGTVEKAGNSDVAVSEIPAGARLKVNAGVLQLAQPLAASWPSDMRGTIPNPTFEGLATEQKIFSNGETVGGWTATVVDANSVRIITDGQWYFSGAPLMPHPTPDGTCFLTLKGVGHIQTTFTLPAAGVYALSFIASGRKNSDGHSFDIIIDGTTRVATVPTYSADWQQYRYRLPWLSAGEHTLLLKTVSTGDIASGLDDFRLDLVDTTEYVNVVSNACFECVAPGNYAKAFTFATGTGKGWEFSDGGNGGYVHVKAQGSLFRVYDATPPRTIKGSPACNLQEFGRRNLYVYGDGIATTTVTFPAAGDYILSLRVCRTRFGNLDWSAASELTAMIDGCVTQIVTTARDVYETKTIGPFTAPANTPLALRLSGTAGKCVMLVDDILVTKVDAPDLIQNGGFETDSGYWTYINDPDALSYGKVLAERFAYAGYIEYYGTNVFEGAYRLKLCDTGAAWQTFTVSEPGVYQFVCHANSRETGSSGQNPIAVKLIAGGVTNVIGRFTTYDRNFRRHAFLFHAPEAGAYTILLEGQTPWAGKIGAFCVNDRTSLIDNVSVRKVQVDADGLQLPEETVIEVAADARINLNFIGTNQVDTVRYAGQTASGYISTATHPEFVDGAGVLYTPAKGTLLRVF